MMYKIAQHDKMKRAAQALSRLAALTLTILLTKGNVMAESQPILAQAAPSSQVEYREVPGYSRYRVGNDGSIWRRACEQSGSEWKEIEPTKRDTGYLVTTLRAAGKKPKQWKIHRLVLEAFVGPCPKGMVCCHNDGTKDNNRLENLRWDTPKSNIADALRHKTFAIGEKQWCSVLTEEVVLTLRNRVAAGEAIKSVADEFGIPFSNAYHVVIGHTWKHVGGPLHVPRALLSPELVREIRKRHANGESQVSIGRSLGMHYTIIGRIVRRQQYANVT